MSKNSESKIDMKYKEEKEEKKGKEEKNLLQHNNSQLIGKYIHDIRNSQTFTKKMLENMNNMCYEDRLNILLVYNEMIIHYSSFFD